MLRIMKDQINGNAVLGRDLHEFLESKQDFTTWMKGRIEKYGFVENEDFTFHKVVEGKVIKHEYLLKMDMAKELSMIEGNSKGKQARQYFIKCEKQLVEVEKPKSVLELVQLTAMEMQRVESKVIALEQKFDSVVTLESGKQRLIQKAVAKRVYERYSKIIPMKERNDVIYYSVTRKMFSGIYRELKNKFGVASYKDIKVSQFEDAMKFISSWIEDAEVRG